MKILILTLEYPPQIGGIASYIIGYAEYLPQDEAVIYAPKLAGGAEYDARQAWKAYRRKPLISFIWPRWIKLLIDVYRIVKMEHSELIHVHHALPAGYVAWMMRRFLRIPYILFLHGSDFQLIAQHRSRLVKFRRVAESAQLIVVNSEFSKRKLAEMIGTPEKIIILNPCPNKNFLHAVSADNRLEHLRSSLGLAGKKVILTVARLVERKGHMLFANCLPKILHEVPNVVWVVIGDGPKKADLVEVVKKLGLASITRFLPAMPPEELPIYYQLGDVFTLLTHKDEDGVDEAWGTAFLEAAAAGLPAVAGRSGGVEEAVLDSVTGLVVDAHNEQEVVKAVVTLLQDPELARQMGEAGRERVKSEFQWSKQLLKITNV